MEYLVEILIGLMITMGGGLILYHVFGIGKNNKPTHNGGNGGDAKDQWE
ncbi:MAG: hypothetical protein UZ19_OD1000802 [Parcubacteria bacterium OLB19]|nr:MAG: hypothetical protein UZ19_OD1000802 [Parcubacteria bacterium OLB19]